jgi:hypothetical protein
MRYIVFLLLLLCLSGRLLAADTKGPLITGIDLQSLLQEGNQAVTVSLQRVGMASAPQVVS